MNERNMREILDRRPFSPIKIVLSSGQEVVVTHPENVLLTKTKMVVSYPEKDLITWLPLLNVAGVEAVEVQAA